MHTAKRSHGIQKMNDKIRVQPNTFEYKPHLQTLRGIAVLLVIFAHAEIPFFSGGFVGVDIFFVISGYLITGILANQIEETGKLDLVRFYTRRLKRLFPGLITMIVATLIAAKIFMPAIEWQAKTSSSIYAITWTSNLFFSFNIVDYFDELAAKDIFLHTWSLGVEEQFYLVWPFILILSYKSRNKKSHKFYKNLAIFMSVTMTASLALSLFWSESAPLLAFYQMPSRIWQFSAGAIVYTLTQTHAYKVINRYHIIAILAFLSGLLAIITSAILINSEMAYPGYLAIIPTLGAATIIASSEKLPFSVKKVMANNPLTWIGDRSYSLYLWHWPIFVIGFSLLTASHLTSKIALISIAFLASIVSYRYIEYPFWKGSKKDVSSKASFSIAGSASILVIVTFTYVAQLPITSKAQYLRTNTQNPISDFPEIYQAGCDRWYHDDVLSPCIIDTGNTTKTVVLIGDSIGAQWFSFLPAVFPTQDWRIIVHTKSACPIIDEDYFYPRIGKTYDVCTRWRQSALDDIDKIAPDVVVMGSASEYKFSKEQWISGTERILDRVSKSTKNVVVIAGTPRLGFNGPTCIEQKTTDRGKLAISACQNNLTMKHATTVAGYIDIASEMYKNTTLLDLNDIVCPDGVCSAVSKDGQIVYRDNKHLTNSFVISRISVIREKIDDILGI